MFDTETKHISLRKITLWKYDSFTFVTKKNEIKQNENLSSYKSTVNKWTRNIHTFYKSGTHEEIK